MKQQLRLAALTGNVAAMSIAQMFFDSPENDRTKLFLSQILQH